MGEPRRYAGGGGSHGVSIQQTESKLLPAESTRLHGRAEQTLVRA